MIFFDANEGKTVSLGCLTCHDDVEARLSVAQPFRMYVAALQCDCGEQIIEFDVFSMVVA